SRFVRRVRDLRQGGLPFVLGGGKILFQPSELLLHLPQSLELLRRRLPVDLLPCAQLVDLRNERSPALVCREQLVERRVGCTPGERGSIRVGIVPRGSQVDHVRECRYASRTWATPSSSAEGQTKSASSLTR